MDFKDSPAEAAFRAEVRAWLAANAPAHELPPGVELDDHDYAEAARAWVHRKAGAGYAAILWPQEVGGRGGTSIEALIFEEEEEQYGLPVGPVVRIGLNLAVPTILKHGTPVQQAQYAGLTLRGEATWCQLFSEPGAGSDLAALRTRAVRDGGNWIINGQKVWSSWAHEARWGILLARTDPAVPKHKGITFFVLDMQAPGIEVRPIRQISGKKDFNEVFFTDVVIPDSQRIGAVGEGWACAMTTLTGERLSNGSGRGTAVRELIARTRAARGAGGVSMLDDGARRMKLARWWAQEQGVKYLGFRLRSRAARGKPPGAESAMMKLVYSSRLQETAAYEMELDGLAGLFLDPALPARAEVFEDYLWSSAMRVAGGADEVLRNLLAERVLQMPGEIRLDKDTPFNELK